ncbi:MAG: hypothetical protein EBV64_13385 [Oxalobacteraceae bacterium]|jgi:uncharacterized tellurite resistance protein B-like protein|nr:hypothetical protein [Oxalobacteraceae bacterium]
MGSSDLFKALTGGRKPKTSPQEIRLTPYVAIVSAILYMMAVDGEISERESSQLQSVIGSDEDILHSAIAYVETHSIDQFLVAAPPLLDAKARLCLLLNVCDSLMADGQLSAAELTLFEQMLGALGHTQSSFQPYYDVISIKDTTSVLGDFSIVPAAGAITPPMALLVSLLYMMSADGSMSEEEIGRLNAVGSVSPTLLKASLRYVGQINAAKFLSSVTSMLNERQRLCILLNACDTMMSDRVVANAEHQLFRRMVAAFELDPKSIGGYLNVIGLKNDVPTEGGAGKANETAVPPPRSQGRTREEGVVFERKRTWEEETGDPGKAGKDKRAVASNAVPKDAAQLESMISSTMRDNIDDLRQQMDGGESVDLLKRSANEPDDESALKTSALDKGQSELRAFRDAEGFGSDSKAGRDKGPSDLRTSRDAGGPADLRTERDADGPSDLRTERDADGPSDLRTERDAGGPSDLRKARDADGSLSRTAGSRDGPADLRTARDADGAAGRSAHDNDGPADLRTARDADGSSEADRGQSEGPSDLRADQDAGAADGRRHQDASGSQKGPHWQDADTPGKHREISDADAPPSGKNYIDDRKSFDEEPGEAGRGPWLEDEISDRALSIIERTQTIQSYVEAMLATKSIIAASRLPPLPVVPIERRERFPAPVSPEVEEEPKTITQWMDSEQMLFGSDLGGPIMSESPPPANKEEANLNRRLRQWSAALLPALFLTYGTTLAGESVAERAFITHQNLATDAHTVHQMTVVQQSVYRVSPDAVVLAGEQLPAGVTRAAGSAAASGVAYAEAGAMVGVAELSDREKADKFLERRKQELVAVSQQHQGASAVAAERQQWFVYAQSIILLGLGMAFWGVLYRSMRMLHVSTVTGIVGLLLTANGYWLFVQW